MAQALGIRLRDEQGNELAPGGAALLGLARIDARGLDPACARCGSSRRPTSTTRSLARTGLVRLRSTEGSDAGAGGAPGPGAPALCGRRAPRPGHRRPRPPWGRSRGRPGRGADRVPRRAGFGQAWRSSWRRWGCGSIRGRGPRDHRRGTVRRQSLRGKVPHGVLRPPRSSGSRWSCSAGSGRSTSRAFASRAWWSGSASGSRGTGARRRSRRWRPRSRPTSRGGDRVADAVERFEEAARGPRERRRHPAVPRGDSDRGRRRRGDRLRRRSDRQSARLRRRRRGVPGADVRVQPGGS